MTTSAEAATSAPKWPVYSLGLKARAEVAARTLEFRFDKPSELAFKAGQFMDVTLLSPPETDAEGNTRGFSINSAPDDADLVFTTRLRDTAFKRSLQSIPLATAFKIEGPFGNFTLHNKAQRPAVLLAGGIGVTPFRSIARSAAHQKLPHRIILFYANRRPEDAPFLDELSGLASANPRFTFVPTMTQAGRSERRWSGETGRIDEALLARHLSDIRRPESGLDAPIYYVAGPAPMVAGLRAVLHGAGVDDDDIRTEEFAGY